MVIEAIPIRSLWVVIKWLPSFLLRRYFTKERLAQLIYVDLQPRHESAVVDLGQSATFRINLQVINLSPVSVELDRASFSFWCGGSILDASILERKVIASGEIASLYIKGNIPDGSANQIALHQVTNPFANPFALSGNIEFNCRIRSFAKQLGHLDGINMKVYNLQARKVT